MLPYIICLWFILGFYREFCIWPPGSQFVVVDVPHVVPVVVVVVSFVVPFVPFVVVVLVHFVVVAERFHSVFVIISFRVPPLSISSIPYVEQMEMACDGSSISLTAIIPPLKIFMVNPTSHCHLVSGSKFRPPPILGPSNLREDVKYYPRRPSRRWRKW